MRERSGSGGLRESGSMGRRGGRRVHYVHRSATMSNPKSHPYFNICASQMDAVSYGVSVRACVCVLLDMWA